jgi:LPXTG-motif cell wall-anchored protein
MKKVKRIEKKYWFRKDKGFVFSKRVPISWEGYLLLFAFLAVNFFSVFYFNLPYTDKNSYFGFLIVLLLSSFVFIVISKRKTRGKKKDF